MKKILLPIFCLVALAVFGQMYWYGGNPSGTGSGGVAQNPAYLVGVVQTYPQSIANSTRVVVSYDTIVNATNIGMNTISGFIYITNAGLYTISATTKFATPIANSVQCFIDKNGVDQFMAQRNNMSNNDSIVCTCTVNCAANDQLQIVIWHNAGASVPLGIGIGPYNTYVSVTRIVQ